MQKKNFQQQLNDRKIYLSPSDLICKFGECREYQKFKQLLFTNNQTITQCNASQLGMILMQANIIKNSLQEKLMQGDNKKLQNKFKHHLSQLNQMRRYLEQQIKRKTGVLKNVQSKQAFNQSQQAKQNQKKIKQNLGCCSKFKRYVIQLIQQIQGSQNKVIKFIKILLGILLGALIGQIIQLWQQSQIRIIFIIVALVVLTFLLVICFCSCEDRERPIDRTTQKNQNGNGTGQLNTNMQGNLGGENFINEQQNNGSSQESVNGLIKVSLVDRKSLKKQKKNDLNIQEL